MGKDKPKPYNCHYCKKHFMGINKREKTVYCSHDCYLDDRYGVDRPKGSKFKAGVVCKITIKKCLDCNALMVCKRENYMRCRPCAYLKNIERANQREHEVRIPNRKSGDKITRKELYIKDGGRCYICHQMTILHNKGKKRNKRLATIDHVIPVSRGGTHTWGNVRNCCWQCNMRKGSKELNDYQEIMEMTYE